MFGKFKVYLKNIFKTVYFNFKFLPFNQAIFLPILVSKNVIINKNGKGKIIIDDAKKASIYIGFPCLNTADYHNERSVLHIDGTLVLSRNAFLAQGCKIDIRKGAIMELGDAFNSTGKMELICFKRIHFGADCTISWDTLCMDSDAHSIYNSEGSLLNKNTEIEIGNHCWIGCRSIILKGVKIADNTVIASNSLITKSIIEKNTIVGGQQQKELRNNIKWSLDSPNS